MECNSMLNFIFGFTVCQQPCLGVSSYEGLICYPEKVVWAQKTQPDLCQFDFYIKFIWFVSVFFFGFGFLLLFIFYSFFKNLTVENIKGFIR